MKTLIITEAFDAYPAGTKLRSFAAGEEVEVSNTFADIVVAKGLGRETAPKAETAKPRAADAAEQKDETA